MNAQQADFRATRRRSRWRWLALLALILLLPAAPSLAQGPTPTLDEINTVARELYCPLCNGVRLDTCELQACIQMREVIAIRLAEGAGREEIKKEFVAQYGPVVLGEPPRQGLNLITGWLLPAAALLAGAAWLFYTARRWTRSPRATGTILAPASANGERVAPSEQVADPYLARVEAELAELE